jgi:hypothetical protein
MSVLRIYAIISGAFGSFKGEENFQEFHMLKEFLRIFQEFLEFLGKFRNF